MKPVRIGTRGSKLAMWQAQWVADQLQQRGIDTELIIISTQGDVTTGPLSQGGGQGLFTKEIQRELLENRVDVAVHSLKDLPTQPVEGLILSAVPSRENTADCLISRNGKKFAELPAHAKIGTGSSRRAAQLRRWRQDIEVQDIRGNVDSRLRKLEEGLYDAIVLAAAGLTRLKLFGQVTEQLPQERVLPAVGQGALGLECRQDDTETIQALSKLDDPESHAAVVAERALLRTLMAGCLAPVAALGRVVHDEVILRGRVIALDGSEVLEGQVSGSATEPELVGIMLGNQLLEQGADRLISQLRSK
ncbi:MAG: hydroxymethylbilane synthase [Pirellulales bacterium]